MRGEAFRDYCVKLMASIAIKGVVQLAGRFLSSRRHRPGVAPTRTAYYMLGEGGIWIAEWEHVSIIRCKTAGGCL